jgi:hypothetical protein
MIEIESILIAGEVAQGFGRTVITRPDSETAASEQASSAMFVLVSYGGARKIHILSPWSGR